MVAIMYQFLHQTRKRNCGQTCLAMLTGKPIQEVEAGLGTTGTKTKELAAWLRQNGFHCPDRLVKLRKGAAHPKGPCIFKQVRRFRDGRPRSGWHWILYSEGLYFDPLSTSGPSPTPPGLTSYLPLNDHVVAIPQCPKDFIQSAATG
jgi:hypothetical protein